MSENRNVEAYEDEYAIGNSGGQWLGWIAIILGVISFFWQPVWTAVIAVVLGIIGLFSPQKTLNWVGIIIAAISLLITLL